MDAQNLLNGTFIVGALAGVILVLRRVGSADGSQFSLFPPTWETPWPRGVQEDEPTRFRVELLERNPAMRTPAGLEPNRTTPAAASRHRRVSATVNG
jgi:hypothetical protein